MQHHVKDLLDVRVTTWLILFASVGLATLATELLPLPMSPARSIEGFVMLG